MAEGTPRGMPRVGLNPYRRQRPPLARASPSPVPGVGPAWQYSDGAARTAFPRRTVGTSRIRHRQPLSAIGRRKPRRTAVLSRVRRGDGESTGPDPSAQGLGASAGGASAGAGAGAGAGGPAAGGASATRPGRPGPGRRAAGAGAGRRRAADGRGRTGGAGETGVTGRRIHRDRPGRRHRRRHRHRARGQPPGGTISVVRPGSASAPHRRGHPLHLQVDRTEGARSRGSSPACRLRGSGQPPA